ncbi:hypothetical protein V5O48_008640 [Marasmius crinis-equi]|uniref:HMG box domain-containing protein n=1 Tax=Marasmius crinis-equi TaxID=585013 RepID=A0ABR3FDP8_9AGAR
MDRKVIEEVKRQLILGGASQGMPTSTMISLLSERLREMWHGMTEQERQTWKERGEDEHNLLPSIQHTESVPLSLIENEAQEKVAGTRRRGQRKADPKDSTVSDVLAASTPQSESDIQQVTRQERVEKENRRTGRTVHTLSAAQKDPITIPVSFKVTAADEVDFTTLPVASSMESTDEGQEQPEVYSNPVSCSSRSLTKFTEQQSSTMAEENATLNPMQYFDFENSGLIEPPLDVELAESLDETQHHPLQVYDGDYTNYEGLILSSDPNAFGIDSEFIPNSRPVPVALDVSLGDYDVDIVRPIYDPVLGPLAVYYAQTRIATRHPEGSGLGLY